MEAAVDHVRYLSVITTQPDAVRRSYLYESAKVVSSQPTRYGRTGMIVTITAESDQRAQYLAEYQAGRLNSGMHGAQVHETLQAARDHISAF